MKFSDIKGHEKEKETLRRMADINKIPHALLLYGTQGTGKFMLARAFAQYINCTNRHDGDSCGVCEACRQTETLNNPDLHYIFPVLKKSKGKAPYSSEWTDEWRRMLAEHPWMEPEEWNTIIEAGNSQPQIYAEQSGEISRIESLSTFSSDYKIFMIWQPERMGEEAANKILKILEEPYADTLFIFVCNDAGRLLPTIYSRLQRVEVGRYSDSEVAGILAEEGVPQQKAHTLASLSHGSVSAALELARSDSETEEFGDYFRQAMRFAYSRKALELKELADSLSQFGREKGMRVADYFSAQVRENYIYNLHVGALNSLTQSEEAFSCKFAPFIHERNVEAISSEINRVRTDIGRNANSKVVWFDFLLHLMLLIRMPRNS